MEGQQSPSTKKAHTSTEEYEDLLPVMAEKLDIDAFVSELCGGFRLLAEPESGLITAVSLRRNSALLGMDGMSKRRSRRQWLSPGMMENAEEWLEKALDRELLRQPGSSV
ncbi:hypothetical protein Syun_019841 [Stephania yunnanensis]|uniref:Uncharacterized protein n=1 Tax=Stephania yunnanensis TaxID=152371 RepID=A0AAP0IUY2_9MAGN